MKSSLFGNKGPIKSFFDLSKHELKRKADIERDKRMLKQFLEYNQHMQLAEDDQVPTFRDVPENLKALDDFIVSMKDVEFTATEPPEVPGASTLSSYDLDPPQKFGILRMLVG